MKLKYMGLKPVISEHGISFKDGKEDKFVYLSFAIDILISIIHTYEKDKKYSHNLSDHRLSPDEILEILLKFHPNLEENMNKEIDSYIVHLDNEVLEVKNRKTLTEIEKETYISNLKIMKEYQIQRAKNKIFYMHCIDTIAQTIIKYKIKELDTPFNERFWHILQTIEGKLSLHKIGSNLKVLNEKDNLKAMLLINII